MPLSHYYNYITHLPSRPATGQQEGLAWGEEDINMNILDVTNTIPKGNYSTDRQGYDIKAAVLHITGDNKPQQALRWFQDPRSKVSANFLVEKDGTVEMAVHPLHRAYHSGIVNKPTAKIYKDMGGINPNLYTIGVECVAKAFEKLTSSQVIVLPELLLYIHRTYHVTLDNIYGHNQFDSINRALDPVSVYTVKSAVEGVYFQKLIEYTPVVKSPVYWQQNAIEGKGINGAWLKQLVLNYVAMYVIVNDYHEAIEYLVSKGIITTPDYWLSNASVFKGDYVRKLLSNMGKVL